MEKKTSRERIRDAYIDYVLTNNQKPASVYAFVKKLKLAESTFYKHYPSFEALEAGIWEELFRETLTAVEGSAEYDSFSARDKTLSVFYAFTETMKPNRSFIRYSFKDSSRFPGDLHILQQLRKAFNEFSANIIAQGLESGELSKRKYLDHRYKDALWLQLVFIIRFWIHDASSDFEKTDEAIERGLQLTFDLMGHSPLDNLMEYGKFIFQNAGFAYEGAK